MVLIGLMGIKNSGKDTCADYLVKNYGFIKNAFADPLKKACQELFMFTDEQVYGTLEQKETPDPQWYNCTPRKVLQYVGTDLLRDNLDKIMPGLGKNVFTHRFGLWYRAELIKNPNLLVVVPDVRFQNEVDFIHSLGGHVVKLVRHSNKTCDMHSSEIELQNITNYDNIIFNDGSLQNFYDSVDYWINDYIDKLSNKEYVMYK